MNRNHELHKLEAAQTTSTPEHRSSSSRTQTQNISAVEQAFNILTIYNANDDSTPNRPTEAELLALEDPLEALQIANSASLSAQVHLDKARKMLGPKGGHVVVGDDRANNTLLGPREKLEVEKRYMRAQQELADALHLREMAAGWLRAEWDRVREMIK